MRSCGWVGQFQLQGCYRGAGADLESGKPLIRTGNPACQGPASVSTLKGGLTSVWPGFGAVWLVFHVLPEEDSQICFHTGILNTNLETFWNLIYVIFFFTTAGARKRAGRSKMARHYREGSSQTVPLPWDVCCSWRPWVKYKTHGHTKPRIQNTVILLKDIENEEYCEY